MECDLSSRWRVANNQEDLPVGTLFAAQSGDLTVLCLVAHDGNDKFPFVLAANRSDADLQKYPPPVSRSFHALTGSLRYVYSGPILSIVPEPDGFPIFGEPAHRNLLVDEGGDGWLVCDDYPHPPKKERVYLNLQTGRCRRTVESKAVLYTKWKVGIKTERDAFEVIFQS